MEQSSELDSKPYNQTVSHSWGCTVPFGTFLAHSVSCQRPSRNSLIPLCYILLLWHNILAQPRSIQSSRTHLHCVKNMLGHQVLLPAEPFLDPELLLDTLFTSIRLAGMQAGVWEEVQVPQKPAHLPCLLPSPGVWKLSATSWLPQIHMGRGS